MSACRCCSAVESAAGRMPPAVLLGLLAAAAYGVWIVGWLTWVAAAGFAVAAWAGTAGLMSPRVAIIGGGFTALMVAGLTTPIVASIVALVALPVALLRCWTILMETPTITDTARRTITRGWVHLVARVRTMVASRHERVDVPAETVVEAAPRVQLQIPAVTGQTVPAGDVWTREPLPLPVRRAA